MTSPTPSSTANGPGQNTTGKFLDVARWIVWAILLLLWVIANIRGADTESAVYLVGFLLYSFLLTDTRRP